MDINNEIFLNNNAILISVTNELKDLIKNLNNDIIIKRISNIINIMNKAINNNKKNYEKIIELIQDMNTKIEELTNKDNNNKIYIKNYPEGKYEGQLVNNMREGKGKLYYIDNEDYMGKISTGEWKNDLRNGKGVEIWKDGERFVGDFINDKREGYGVYYYAGGDRYEGNFKNNKKEGQGVYYYKNGNRQMGNFYNDNPIGKAVLLTVSNEVKTIDY